MKILYIITQSEWGGAQKNVLDLACELAKKHEILIAAGHDGGSNFFAQLKENNIKFFRLKYLRRSAKNPFLDALSVWEIFKLLKKEKPDILHLHSSKAGFVGAIAGKLAKIKKIIHTVHGAVFEAPFSKSAKIFYLWLEKFGAKFKDKIICVSKNDKKIWLKYNVAPENKLVVIHNGIDLEKMEFLPKNEARESLAGLSVPFFEAMKSKNPDLKIVGAIANFYPEKGLPYFIQAATTIFITKKDLLFVIIGEGRQRILLEEMIKDARIENKFILAGAVKNASRYLKAFDVLVLPSIKEGFPYAILEAMAAGLPIVTSHIGGIPEIIQDSQNGFLTLPKNSEMLARNITELIENPLLIQKFSQNNLEKIKEFSVKRMVEETENIYLN